MKSKKTQDEFDGKVTSWTQKIGVSMIGLLTALGAGLIVYTGVMAATHEQPKSENDYLTYDKVEMETSDDSIDVNQDTAVDQKQEEVTPPATDSSNEQSSDQTHETGQQPSEKPVQQEQTPVQTNNNEAYCNVDGVNVRAKAATGTDIIGNLDAGDKVKVLDRYYSDEWIQISFEGEIGYVYAEYLTFK